MKTELLIIQDEANGSGKGKSNICSWKKEIMESRAIQEITKRSDGTGYRKWLNNMKNLLEQARPGGRKMIMFLAMPREEGTIVKMQSMGDGTSHADAIEAIYNDKMEKQEFESKLKQLVDIFEEMDRDVWTILLEKQTEKRMTRLIRSYKSTVLQQSTMLHYNTCMVAERGWPTAFHRAAVAALAIKVL